MPGHSSFWSNDKTNRSHSQLLSHMLPMAFIPHRANSSLEQSAAAQTPVRWRRPTSCRLTFEVWTEAHPAQKWQTCCQFQHKPWENSGKRFQRQTMGRAQGSHMIFLLEHQDTTPSEAHPSKSLSVYSFWQVFYFLVGYTHIFLIFRNIFDAGDRTQGPTTQGHPTPLLHGYVCLTSYLQQTLKPRKTSNSSQWSCLQW